MQNNYNTNIENTRQNTEVLENTNQNPYINQNAQTPLNNQTNTNNTNSSLFGAGNGDFIKGALVGAAVTYLLTNKKAQSTIMNAFSKGNEFVQAGMEELKERYEDMKAQQEAKKEF